MSLETGVDGPEDLNPSNPAAGDVLTEGDDHLRLIKVAVKRFCWEHVGTAAVVGAASISTYSLFGAFESGYDYQLSVNDVYLSSATSVRVRVTTGGGVVDSGSNYALSEYLSISSAGSGNSSTTSVTAINSIGDAATESGHTEITVLNPQGTTNPRHLFFVGSGGGDVSLSDYVMGGGMYRTTTAIDGLSVASSGVPTITATAKLFRRFRPT